MAQKLANMYSLYPQLWDHIVKLQNPNLNLEYEVLFLKNVLSGYKLKICTLLDLGCGTGRHSVALTDAGFQVTGLDISASMLKVGKSIHKNLDTICADFTNCQLPNNYDAAISMWSTPNLMLDETAFNRFITSISPIINHLLILDSANFYTRKKESIERPEPVEDEKYVLRMERFSKVEFPLRKQWYEIEIFERISARTYKFTDYEETRFFTLEEMKKLFMSKFRLYRVYGEYDTKSNFDEQTSSRMISIWERIR
jgi:SAM-dependent methyltransferase